MTQSVTGLKLMEAQHNRRCRLQIGEHHAKQREDRQIGSRFRRAARWGREAPRSKLNTPIEDSESRPCQTPTRGVRSRVICPGGVGFETSSASGGRGAGLVAKLTRPGLHGGECSRGWHPAWHSNQQAA